MQPKSKRQRLVVELSSQLPEIAEELNKWAFKNCIEHVAHRNKLWTSCLSCGHVWPTTSMKIKTEICPGCKWKLSLKTTRFQKSQTFARFAVLDVKGDFQVVRYFNINCDMKTRREPRYYTREIMQHWILENGEFEVISAQVGGLGLSYDHFGSTLSLKNRKDIWKYNIAVCRLHPALKLQPIYKRNGLVHSITSIRPFDLLRNLTNDSKTETMLKAKQMSLLSHYLGDRRGSIYSHWPSIKICLRSGFIIKDAGMYLDYLDLLRWFAKDLRNSKYVCPTNLKHEHDRLVKKKIDITKKQDIERRKRQAEEEQKDYFDSKSLFFGLMFQEGELEIKVLESVQDFISESDAHKHCIYSNGYYKKENSLCFSAKVNGVPAETIEVDLANMKVTQSRGMQNTPSSFHDKIVGLMNKNMQLIQKRKRRPNRKMEEAA